MTKKQTIVAILFAVCIVSFIWMDATHAIRDGNQNYSPEAFRFGNMEPWLWLMPIFGLAMLLLPWFWRAGASANVWAWSVFPCRKTVLSRTVGMLLTLLNIAVAIPAVILTACSGITATAMWYAKEDLAAVLFLYVSFGIIALIANLCYGLLSPRKYH